LDGGEAESAPARDVIRVEANGPLYVTGQLEITDDRGRIVCTDSRVALCRCGASANKPFCDNSHRGIGFEG
jgi:CDGSH-type Zn-finger protein